jgi:lambda family phage tail tape measure protein
LADRQLKITVRTEIRKGFEQLAKQLEGLSSQLNKLNQTFDHIATKADKAAKANNNLNKSVSDGVQLANKYASGFTKAGAAAEKVNAAYNKGQISRKQRIEAELNLLSKVVKTEDDLARLRGRNSKGQFGYSGFSKEVIAEVSRQFKLQSLELNNQTSIKKKNISLDERELQIAKELKFIRQTQGKFTSGAQNFGSPFGPFRPDNRGRITGRGQQYGPPSSAYPPNQYLAALQKAGGFGTQDPWATQYNDMSKGYYNHGVYTRGRPPSGGGYGGGRSGGSYSSSGGGNSRGLGIPSGSDLSAVQKLYQTYVGLGHTLFLLKYSFLTIFGLSGIGVISKQVDTFVTLRNQIARTSDSINDLGTNMKAVKDIANSTFTDVGAVGQIFSSINKYSANLGINKTQVATVTRNIAGAYAASPGTADAKAAAQYQLIQAITSNRLGGDELRSQLEQAPMVAEILMKGVAKLRGKPGQTINLRDQNHPVTTSEIVKVFSDPEITQQLKKLIGAQARTFGDAIQVAKNRLVDVGGALEKYLVPAITHIAGILSDDTKWKSFTDGIKAATVALVALAVGAGVKGLFGVKGVASTAIVGAGRAVGGFAGDVGTYFAGASRAANLRGVGVAGLVGGDILKGTLPAIGNFLKAMLPMGTVLGLVAAAVVILVARFQNILSKFGDGINLFTIMEGLWDRLSDSMSGLVQWIQPAIDGVWNFIDGPLKELAKWAKNDEFIQKRNLSDRFGVNATVQSHKYTEYGSSYLVGDESGLITPHNKRYSVTKNQIDSASIRGAAGVDLNGKPTTLSGLLLPDSNGNWQTRSSGSPDDGDWAMVFDPKTKRAIGYTSRTASLPTGVKSNLPPTTQTGQHKRDPWKEFVTDTNLAINEAKSFRGLTGSGQTLQRSYEEVMRRAGDAMDLKNYHDLSPDKKKVADDLAKSTQIERLKDIMKDLTESALQSAADAVQNSLSSGIFDAYSQNKFENMNNALANALKGDNFSGTAAERNTYLARAAKGESYVSMGSDIRTKLRDPSLVDVEANSGNTAFTNRFLGQADTENKLNKLKLENETKLSSIFGRERDYQAELLDIKLKYVQAGMAGTEQEREELELVKKRKELDDKNRGNAVYGAMNAVSQYQDHLDDVAGNISDVFTRAFQGMEDSLVNFIQTGKLSFSDLARSIIADLTRIFVEYKIMKPIVDWMKGDSGGTGSGTNWIATAATYVAKAFIHHDGGIAGSGSVSRMVNPTIFAGAHRYHMGGIAGIKPDEVPAILQRGERIIPRGGSGGHSVFAPSVHIEYNTSGGSGNDKVSQDHAENLASMVQKAIRKEIIEYDRKSRMPGTDAYMARKF